MSALAAPAATNIRRKTSAEPNGQTERLVRDAHVILDGVGYPMSRPKVSRLVRRYETTVARNGWSLFDFIATAVQLDAEQKRRAMLHPDIARVIAYADPTGEAAVRNVMRSQ